uniref:Uncharacterized protein n=1 Tax=Oreochromis aureus TaxID=47969 RepID=A0A668UJY9_OREAU
MMKKIHGCSEGGLAEGRCDRDTTRCRAGCDLERCLRPQCAENEYKKGVEEVKYMRGDENRVNARNQENLEKSNVQHKGKQQKEVPAPNIKSNIHTSESQQEFFRMLDEKIEKGRDYCSEEEEEDGT